MTDTGQKPRESEISAQSNQKYEFSLRSLRSLQCEFNHLNILHIYINTNTNICNII